MDARASTELHAETSPRIPSRRVGIFSLTGYLPRVTWQVRRINSRAASLFRLYRYTSLYTACDQKSLVILEKVRMPGPSSELGDKPLWV